MKASSAVTPAIECAVTTLMERAGFAIQRTTPKTVVWRRDLVGSHLLVSFADNELYGDPGTKEWTLIHCDDDVDGRVRIKWQLDLRDALSAADAIEAAATKGRSTPTPTSSVVGNA